MVASDGVNTSDQTRRIRLDTRAGIGGDGLCTGAVGVDHRDQINIRHAREDAGVVLANLADADHPELERWCRHDG